MAKIEPYIVSAIIQLANMRVPITTSQGLQLCNSIIHGTKFQRVVAEFQKKISDAVLTSLVLDIGEDS
jgi:cyclophilin family peptidyl-prolyl cis-trans isomerase